ncbi:MAG: DUF5329 family protein [Thermodesulfobacteriota bacterium]
MNKKIVTFTFVLMTLVFSGVLKSSADVPASQKPEVEHLLEFIESTQCEFERNGKKYSGERASKHIKRKYKHFRDQISTTEEFIEYSGTKSTISGKDYLVYCDSEQPVTSKDWLMEELVLFREQSS